MKHIRKRRNCIPCLFPISLTSLPREVTNRLQQRTFRRISSVTSAEAVVILPQPLRIVNFYRLSKRLSPVSVRFIISSGIGIVSVNSVAFQFIQGRKTAVLQGNHFDSKLITATIICIYISVAAP